MHLAGLLRFVLPHGGDLRPRWLIRLGLALYDNLGARKRLPASNRVDLNVSPLGRPLAANVKYGFAYSECCVDDSRLVILNAIDASDRVADIRLHTAVAEMRWEDGGWRVSLRPANGNEAQTVTVRVIVNAVGPWIGQTIDGAVSKNIRLVKGSRITVPKF